MYFLEASEFSLRMFEGFHFNGHMKFGGAESLDLIQHYLVSVLIAWCQEKGPGDPRGGSDDWNSCPPLGVGVVCTDAMGFLHRMPSLPVRSRALWW